MTWTPESDLLKVLDPFGTYGAAEKVTRLIVNSFGRKTKDQLAEEQQEAWLREQQALADEKLANDIASKINTKGGGPISNTTINYYNQTLVPEGGKEIKLPIPPASKLKPIAITPDTHPFQDKKQPVITVEQAINEKLWGGLLHEPLSASEINVTAYSSSGLDSAITSLSSQSLSNLNAWAKGDVELSPRSMSLLFLDKVDMQAGSIAQIPVYGTDAISLLYASFRARSSNTSVPALSTIPKSINVNRNKSISARIDRPDIEIGFIPNSTSDFEEIELPQSLTNPDKKGTTKVKSTSEAFAYLILMLDGLVGEFPLNINIEDESLGLSGNQKVGIKIPNLAEGIAEIFGLLFHTNQHGQLNTIINTKALVIATQNLISSNVTQDVSLAVADYLGFKLAEVERKIKIPIDPEKEKVTELLKDSEQKYKSYDFQDDKNLQHHLVRFNEASAIVKAALYKRFNTKDLEKEIKEYLNTLKGEVSGEDNSEWRAFLNKVEGGFADEKTAGKDKPYGKNYQNRPHIRDLTHDNNNQ